MPSAVERGEHLRVLKVWTLQTVTGIGGGLPCSFESEKNANEKNHQAHLSLRKLKLNRESTAPKGPGHAGAR